MTADMTLKDTLFELCSLVGVGGFEKEIRQWILEQARPYADEIRTDKLGNLMVYRKGIRHPDTPLAFFAHMDEPGLLVKKITKDGMLQLMGSMPAKSIIGKQLAIQGLNGPVYGVCGMKADHLQTAEEQKKTPQLSRLLVDIGCTCEEEARKLVREGNMAVPLVEAELLGGGSMMTGRGLASRAGCAVLLELLKEKPACDCWFVFTVSGENWDRVPGKGAIPAVRQLNPGLAVMLHAADTGEGPGVSEEDVNCRCGQGAAISLMDGDFVFERRIRQMVTDEADRQGIRWQFHKSGMQVTGAGHLASGKDGCVLLPVNLPVRYLKASAGVCSLEDLSSMAAVCRIVMDKAEICAGISEEFKE